MGLVVKGAWKNEWYDTGSTDGEFVREDSQYRNWITPGENSNPGNHKVFPAAKGRYHLYVSMACPWAHRTLIMRSLKKLQEVIPVTVVKPEMLEHGWTFDVDGGAYTEPNYGLQHLYQLYTKADPGYTGRVTVPVLWDTVTETIVSNESSEIIRMLNCSFGAFSDVSTDYYPLSLRHEIDQINELVYESVNNGVYRCGFATTQAAYEQAFSKLFMTLDQLDLRLSGQRYLIGSQITEADWRLFTTLIRFDAVYFGHFKTNLKRISDYQNLQPYLLDLYQQPGIRETVNMEHIKTHYYYSHDTINPSRIIPAGPDLNFEVPHDRGRFD